MIVVTGASGQLGRLVIHSLLKRIPASQIVAAVRNPASVADLAQLGVQVRQADYSQPASLSTAFAGAQKLLLISSSEVGQRVAQHAAVITAAKQAGVELLAFTSLLHADRSALGLADEYQQTERLIRDSGLAHVILRNGWYTENYLAALPAALAHGVLLGSAGEGRIASAARADYAEAAAVVLTTTQPANVIYELAGDEAYTLSQLAAEVSRVSGKSVVYQDLPEADYRAALLGVGLPEGLASLLADSDRGASQDWLFDDSHQLSQLIARPTTAWRHMVAEAVKG